MSRVYLGSDPELFIGKNGIPVSAIGKIGGTKETPRPLPIGKGFCVQEDNVLLEYNTPPAATGLAWNKNQSKIFDYLQLMVAEKGLEILPGASYSMPASELENPAAWIFGCDPDFNVWTTKMNPRPHSEDETLRSAGGHIHIGASGMSNTEKILLGRMLDITVGVPLTLADKDKRRRELYGKEGSIRFKPYGIEYRTPSNWWAVNGQSDWIFQQVRTAISYLKMGKDPSKYQEMIAAAISGGDEEAAAGICKAFYMRAPV